MNLAEDMRTRIKGDVADDAETIQVYSRDTSIFQRAPKVVVFPKNADDVSAVVTYVREAKERGEVVSIAPRSAGTDMTGGPLTDSISMVFTKYMNHIGPITENSATVEPGTYYRDFEKATLQKSGKLLPSYPASRELCAMGGIVSNNSGGELTLRYGKTNRYVQSLDVVLSDGTHTTLKPIPLDEAHHKAENQDLEGSIYRSIVDLIEHNAAEIEAARPTVNKNSAGYALWNVIDVQKQTFDLTQLVVGSQGTLAIVTQATLGLIQPAAHKAMLIIFLSDYEILPDIVRHVLEQQPESFESYDNKTFSLAMRFMPQMLKQLGFFQALRLGISFIPEMWMAATGGIPRLILLAEFAEETPETALEKVRSLRIVLQSYAVKTKLARTELQMEKYWKVRREAFALLRKRMKGLYAAPIMDDFCVHPKDYPRFLPELYNLLDQYTFTYAVTGHIGDGNFHIFPLVNLSDDKVHDMIMELMPKVYELVQKYGGSITGEHNDGIVRTPFLSYQFSPKMLELFSQVKHIFDPLNIFNPGKKVGGTLKDIEQSMIRHL
ncbi:FAD-binding oxidoreductase [Candidatus Kaiserbacteria bacterium]|nr:FAD-binding oxidoreductase [Candidatus Kaiserbacteria bacterium]